MGILQNLQNLGNRLRSKQTVATPPVSDRRALVLPDLEAQIKSAMLPYAYVSSTVQNLLNDDTVYSIGNVFSDILLSNGWTFEGEDAKSVVDLTDAMTRAPGWNMMLNSLALASFKRFSAVEIVWDTLSDAGKWVPQKYRDLPLRFTSLNLDVNQDVLTANVMTTGGQQMVPPQNMICHRHQPTFEHPLGQSVYDSLQEVIGYKRKADALLIRILERLAGATVIGWYAPGTPASEQDSLFASLGKMVSGSYSIMPGPRGEKGNEVEMLEMSSSAGLDFAITLLNTYERRIARAILGSVLSIYESEHGSRAQASEHTKILTSVVESQQDGIEEPINAQLLRPLLAYNKPNGAALDVRFRLNAPDFSDLSKTGAWVDGLIAAGAIDVENQEDNDLVRELFGVKLRNWSKYPEVPLNDRREAEAGTAGTAEAGTAEAGTPPKLPALKPQSGANPKVA
jgi:hypothetical protein